MDPTTPFDAQQKNTAHSFGVQWEYFSFEMDGEWRNSFIEYIHPLQPEDLTGRLVLDAGCGMGRHARQAALAGARVVAMDLGLNVEEALQHLDGAGRNDLG